MTTISPASIPGPTISVVIPAYNSAAFISKTLDSVLAQTLRPLEIIVVDDGSQDDTAAVVRKYADSVTLIQQQNAGPAAARNHGIREASGEWIALLDADDIWLPQKLEVQAAAITPDVALIHSPSTYDPGRTDQDITFDVLWKYNHIGTSTVLARREIIIAVGGFNEDRALIGSEDYNLWLRIAGAGHKIQTVNEPLSVYSPPAGSLSQQIARVIVAELRNAELIVKHFHLSQDALLAKQAAIYDEYAKALFWKRDLKLARHYYRCLLGLKPSFEAVKFWLATYLPKQLLNISRSSTTQPA